MERFIFCTAATPPFRCCFGQPSALCAKHSNSDSAEDLVLSPNFEIAKGARAEHAHTNKRRPAGAFAVHPGARSEAEVEAAAHDVESGRVETRGERVQVAGYGKVVAAEIDVQILRPDRPVSR